MSPLSSRAVISQERIRRTVRKLAREMDRHFKASSISEISVVCVMDGAFMFCADLVRSLKTPATIVFAKARSYAGEKKGKTVVTPLPRSPRGRPVLVVDTIYDTGVTVKKVLSEVRKQTSKVHLAILLQKRGKDSLPLPSQAALCFVGLTVKDASFLVGYGLDCDGKFRQLRDIRSLTA